MKQVINILLGGLIIASQLSGQSDNTEFRSTWVITWEHIHSSWSVAQNKALVREILDNHQAANMNAVLWQVRQSGTAYYNSSYEPWGYYAGYSDPGYDPLAYAIEQAHARGMELHAWFNTFHASSTHAGAPAAEHPEWVCTDRDSIFMNESRALSPGLAAVRDYTLDVAMEIVNNYDIDGIHLDYIRWNEYTNSTRANLTQIEQESQLDGMISEEQIRALENDRSGRYLYDIGHQYDNGIPTGFTTWEEWWRWSVTTFVEDLHDSIQTVKPHVRLSVAALGKYNWSGWQGYGSVYQDAAKWFNDGSIEQLTPMHYHWLDATGFYDMLTGNCPECWSQYIQTGISDGRLFSAGPGSYRFSDANVWYRHPGVVNICRTIPWVDGFQFFSYGSWEGHQYWDEAGNTFFGKKTKIRPSVMIPVNETPTLALNQNDNLNYDISITPPAGIPNQWFLIYRSPTNNISVDSSEIIAIIFDDSTHTITESFTGNQDFNGQYSYGATMANRYWNESPVSNLVIVDSLTSYAPRVVNHLPQDSSLVPVNVEIVIDFSKKIDAASFDSGLVITPAIPAYDLTWSEHWTDYHRSVTINPQTHLLFDTTYNVTIGAEVVDLNGRPLDGDGDGVGGDAYSFSFTTQAIDLEGPQVEFTFPDSGSDAIDSDEALTILFDELIDPLTVNQNNLTLSGPTGDITLEYLLTAINDENSLISAKPLSKLVANSNYHFTATQIADTAGNLLTEALQLDFQTSDFHYSANSPIALFNSGSENWWQPDGSGSTTGIILSQTGFGLTNGVYLPASGAPGSPRKSGRLNYAWDEDAASHLLRLHNAGSPSDIYIDTSYTLQIYLYGDGSNSTFTFSLYEKNSNGQNTADIIEVASWTAIDWVGWRLVEWDLCDPSQVGDFISQDQAMDGHHYKLDGLLLRHPAGSASTGQIYFDNLRIVQKTAGPAPENSPPVLEEIADTNAVQGQYVGVTVNYTDADASDNHLIRINADNPDMEYLINDHSSGSIAYIRSEPDFLGDVAIELIVSDLGVGELSDTSQFTLTIVEDLAIDNGSNQPHQYALLPNYPNPFNPVTTIAFSLANTGNANLTIYDITGRQVKNIVKSNLSAGYHTIRWSGRDNAGQAVATGVYFYRLEAGSFSATRRMLLLK